MEHNTRHRDRIRRVPDPPENRHGKGPGVSRLRSSTPRESRFYRDLDRRETSTTGKLNEAQPSYAIDDPPAYSTPAEEQKAVNYGGASNTTAPSAGFGTGWGSLNRSEVNSREGEKNQREAAVVTSPEHIAEPPQSTADNSSANDSSWPDNVSSTESSSKLPKRSMFSYPYESQAGVQERSGDLPHEDISWLEATTPKTSPRPDLSDRKQRASAADTPMTHPTDTSSYVPGSASLDKPSDDGRLQPDRSTHTFERPPMHRSTRTSQSRSSPVRDSIDRPISHDTRSRRRRRFGGESSDVELTPSARRSRIDASTYAGGRGPRKMQQVQEDYEDDFEEDREESRARRKEQRKKEKAALKRKLPPTPIHLPEFISVGNLAQVLKVRVEDFSKKMHALGFEETNNDHLLDAEVAGLIAAEFNFEAIVDTAAEDQDLQARPPAQDKAVLPQRPPIVTIMGHVDHGKTTLLDYLRKSSVAASEHGGITQHIGAFSVSMPGGRSGTFLDTPGHAAFLSMRQRGANVTDIVILVVAADDSVKPQTVEAIKHAQAAKVPMIVAINKVDKEDKNIERVKSDLARYGVEIEDFGGDTQVVCVSGKTGQGLDELEDATVALADIIDMRAEADGQSEGWVLEATTKKAGRVATVLVKRGTMRRGDIVVAGSTWAKIRTLKNEAGVQVPYAGPGIPVEVDGWKDQPTAGDEVLQAESEQQAKSAVSFRLKRIEKEQMAADMSAVNESRRLEQEKREAEKREAAIAETAKTNGLKTPSTADTSSKITADANTTTPPSGPAPSPTGPLTLPILLKADVSGSLEACANAITALSSPLITPHILRSSVGPVSPSDIALADSSSAQIISFNQTTSAEIYSHANRLGVKLVEENIIYRLSESVRAELEKMLPPRIERRVLGEAEVGMRFEVGIGGRKKAWVAGCKVRNGVIAKKDKIKVVRGKLGEGEVVVFEGTLFIPSLMSFSSPFFLPIRHLFRHLFRNLFSKPILPFYLMKLAH